MFRLRARTRKRHRALRAGGPRTDQVCGSTPDAVINGENVVDVGNDVDAQLGDGAETTAVDTAPADTGPPDTQQDTDDVSVQDIENTGDAPSDAQDSSAGDGSINCPGSPGCACKVNGDCDNAFCIETANGNVCAASCVDGCKDADFKCIQSGSGPDAVAICVPKYFRVCNPCKVNEDCQTSGSGDAFCVDHGDNGKFCGIACSVNLDCPASYICDDAAKDATGKTVKQCVPKDNAICSCSAAAIKAELSTACYKVAGGAKCIGKRSCLADGLPNAPKGGGLTPCYAPDPVTETCNGQDDNCNGQTDEFSCDDKNTCTDDVCAAASGCQFKANTLGCDADGSLCTKDDTCANSVCVAGKAIVCDDLNVCTTDGCDAKTGCKYDPADGAACNADDNVCTVDDVCKGGKCAPGDKKACASDDQCIVGKCSQLTGKCVYTAGDGSPCDDGSPCTTSDKCKKDADGASSTCGGLALNCDDLNPCTGDSCDPKIGCQHTNLGGPCDDGNACTKSDLCKDGNCAGALIDVASACDDKNQCTDDACDPANGCTHAPKNSGACDDGNPCTVSDTCTNGLCISGLNKCNCTTLQDCAKQEDGNFCNGTLYCDKSGQFAVCKVDPLTVKVCDDSINNQCQSNACEPTTGKCVITKKQVGTPRDADASICTPNDSCGDGACVADKAQDCNDKNPCTDDSCDAKVGCKHLNNVQPCDADGNLCTQNDACAAGVCVAGVAKVCDDVEACTGDSCNPATGACIYSNLQSSCSDGNPCTTNDGCGLDVGGKYTCVGGAQINCDDNNVCTTDACNTKVGCVNTIDPKITAKCYTGDVKTKNKGICKEGNQQCGIDGKLGNCVGEVLPEAKEVCDGADNNCDGVVDEGCAPANVRARFASTLVKASGAKYTARVSVASSPANAAAPAGGNNNSAAFGLYRWLKAVVGLQ